MRKEADPTAPLLVTLGFDRPTFDRLDALRSRYFPPARNVVPAHLSLFHQLPGEDVEEVGRALEIVVSRGPIPLRFPGLKKLGKGVAATVEAPGLAAVHASLAAAFAAWLTPQDRQPFRPHVTLMNKAEPKDAALAYLELNAGWEPWSGLGDALLLWRYLGGPWDLVGRYPFAGSPVTTTY